VGLLNYLPTRLGPAAALLGAACLVEVVRLMRGEETEPLAAVGLWLLGAAPWAALLSCWWAAPPPSPVDRTWRAFRARFGLVWGLRQREQFNRAAVHAGWPLTLSWTGLRHAGEGTPPAQDQALATLRAVLRRFGPPDPDGR